MRHPMTNFECTLKFKGLNLLLSIFISTFENTQIETVTVTVSYVVYFAPNRFCYQFNCESEAGAVARSVEQQPKTVFASLPLSLRALHFNCIPLN